MVKLSLIAKIYMYALGVLVVLFVGALLVGRVLVYEGKLEEVRRLRSDLAYDAGARAEWALRDGKLTDAELRRMEGKYRLMQLSYVPEAEQTTFGPGAVSRAVVVHRSPGPFPWWDRYMVRLKVKGRPAGVLRIAFNPFQSSMRTRILPTTLAGIGLVGLVTVPPLVIWVLLPLRRMVKVAHRLGAGDLETPIKVNRKDEFGDLQRAFEGMRTRLQEMLASRERLMWDISHELRGPLSRMTVALSLLRAQHGEDPYVASLERDVKAMDELVGEVLTLARGRNPQALEREPGDLAAIARGLLEERQVVLDGRALTVETRLEAAPAAVDLRLIRRAMGNLLDNAIKYTPDPGTVRVVTGTEDGLAVFRVEDSGPGIAAGDLPRIFDPFYRPDTSRSRETGGTGLGLAIARAIVESHGGEVSLSSGEGTVARLVVPGGALR